MGAFVLAAVLMVAAFVGYKFLASSSRVRVILEDYEARLKPVDASAGSQARGKSERERYKDGTEEFSLRLYQVDLPDRATLEVVLQGNVIGTLDIKQQRGQFVLNSLSGAEVPRVRAGDVVEVRRQGAAILRGTFRED